MCSGYKSQGEEDAAALVTSTYTCRGGWAVIVVATIQPIDRCAIYFRRQGRDENDDEMRQSLVSFHEFHRSLR